MLFLTITYDDYFFYSTYNIIVFVRRNKLKRKNNKSPKNERMTERLNMKKATESLHLLTQVCPFISPLLYVFLLLMHRHSFILYIRSCFWCSFYFCVAALLIARDGVPEKKKATTKRRSSSTKKDTQLLRNNETTGWLTNT